MTANAQTVKPQVAVIAQFDPADPSSWSGTPAGICKGLAEAGARAIAIDARPPGLARAARTFRAPWTWEATNPLFAEACGAWGDISIRARGVDGVVAIGSGFALRTAVPLVSFEDETVAQALRRPDSPLAAISEPALERWRRRQERIYGRARGCCVASSGVARSIAGDYGIDPAKIHVVGCGRNIERAPAERSWRLPRFLFVGVDWERKRGADVVASFAEVRARHPEATLDVVGAHPPLDAPGVSGHGRLSLSSPQERDRLAALFSRATCLVVPSSSEPFGIVYVEAGAAGIPSIGTTVGGAADAIGEGGIVVDPGDGAALTAAMLELCEPQRARELGERALARSALFTWQAVAERVLRALGLPGFDASELAKDVPAGKPVYINP